MKWNQLRNVWGLLGVFIERQGLIQIDQILEGFQRLCVPSDSGDGGCHLAGVMDNGLTYVPWGVIFAPHYELYLLDVPSLPARYSTISMFTICLF